MPMNDPSENTLNENSGTPDSKACSIIAVIPTLGMSSCRGRAEAFARSLSSKLRTLGSQSEDGALSLEKESIINDNNNGTNTWRTTNDASQVVTNTQPLRHQESDSYFDFDCELESPGSPADECEYFRLIETASNTPHNSATESGYVCASSASSRGSGELPYSDEHIEQTDITDGAECAPSLLHNGYDGNDEIHDETNISLDNDEDNANEHEEQQTVSVETQKADENLKSLDLENIQDDIINKLQEHSARIGTLIESQAGTEIEIATKNLAHTSLSNGEIERKILLALPNENIENNIITTNQITPNITTNVYNKTEETTAQQINEVQIRLDTKESTSTSSQEIINANHIKQTTKAVIEKISSFDANEDDEDDCRPQRVRRCSSLKTGKTPPGTPGRKKIVRFADVLGLDLADIKTFLDEIPTIPKSAFEDLEVLDAEPPIQLGPKSDKLLVPLFQQPGGLPNFLDLVRVKQVSLENAAVTDHINQTITGTVRVRNLDFHKSVHIRYSLDNWRSYADLQANYVENSCDGFSDKFTFFLFGNSLRIGQRIEFAVRFQCKGQQFWDSNYGTNYCFQCLPASTPASKISQSIHVPATHSHHAAGLFSPTVGESWCSSFY
ncbi:glycogen-binding subunit 76A [Eurosta solidaginis]|uniref:glycogen-binding subunit 76A n=1 Tax=Eurosta solidaginis TaxID=178769 RepID=UPI003530D53F